MSAAGRRAARTVALALALLSVPPAAAQAPSAAAQAVPASVQAPPAAVQAVSAPRSVEDILVLLDQYRPDPAATARLQAELALAPPAVDAASRDLRERHLWSIHHHRRARAYGQLGRTAQQIAELNLALQHVWDGAVPEGFDSLGQRVRILNELMVAEAFGGNLLRALEAAAQIGGGDPAWALVGLAPMVRIHAEMGNLPASRAALQRAEAAYAHLQTLPSWGFTGTNWRAMMGLGRGALEQAQGHLAEAERLWRQRVADSETAANTMAGLRQYSKLPPPPEMMLQLWADAELQLSKNLALQGRSGEAESHARSALLKVLQGFGRYSTQSAQAITDLGSAVFEAGRFRDAAALARAAIASYEQGGAAPESWYFALARGLLGSALAAQGRWAEADAVYEARDRGLASDAGQYQSAEVSGRDVNWGYAMLRNGKAQAGLELLERVYRRRLRLGLSNEEYFTAQARGFYALGLAATGRKGAALQAFRGALPVLLEDARRGGGEQGGAVGRQLRLVWILEGYMQLLVELEATAEGKAALGAARIDVAAETFRVADIARGGAVQRALAESAARATPEDPALAALARREQDAEQRFGALSDLLNRMLALPPERQVPAVLAELRAGIETLRGERAALKRELARRFPGYADLIAPHPPDIAAVQAALREGEALLSIYVGAQRSYVWAVPRRGAPAFAPVALGEAELARTVSGLRRALDVGEAGLARFPFLPRFDLEASHALYAGLLAPVQAGWRGAASLLVVPHKALAQLPFAVLVTAPAWLSTAPPLFAGYRSVPWLLRQTAITQLPSVATLLTLRRMPAGSAARKAFVGFGDPLFSKAMAAKGGAADAGDAGAAGATRGLRLRSLAVASLLARQSSPAVAGIHAPLPATVSAQAGLAQLSRLPDTAEEIQSIARVLGAGDADVLLGAAASEKNAKSGRLDARRIVVFATHGLVSGELDGLTQPALALSAPEVTGDGGDGLLTMEEVLGLKLDADWVVLSACNTASGDGEGSEALSGLGRAFFFAGARTLLASNWPVETVSARLLTTRLFELQAARPGVTRAEALRATMLELMDRVQPQSGGGAEGFTYAHPMFWAPFSLVGDGGR